MINDPKSCSLIKTRRIKMDQEQIGLGEKGVLGARNPPPEKRAEFWDGLGVGSVFFLEGPHPLIESVRFWRLGRRVLVGRGVSWLAGFCGCFVSFVSFSVPCKDDVGPRTSWQGAILVVQYAFNAPNQVWISGVHTCFSFSLVRKLVVRQIHKSWFTTYYHAINSCKKNMCNSSIPKNMHNYSLANGAGILGGTMVSVRTSYFGSTLHPVTVEIPY